MEAGWRSGRWHSGQARAAGSGSAVPQCGQLAAGPDAAAAADVLQPYPLVHDRGR